MIIWSIDMVVTKAPNLNWILRSVSVVAQTSNLHQHIYILKTLKYNFQLQKVLRFHQHGHWALNLFGFIRSVSWVKVTNDLSINKLAKDEDIKTY